MKKGAVIPQKTRIMFETDDMEESHNKAVTKEIKLTGGIRNESSGKLLVFEGPDRHWSKVFENK